MLYVNLEPCNHFGKTPPCTAAVIAAGITQVVCAIRDPNGVAGGGIEKLRKAGIRVSVGTCENEARELNEAFFTFHEKGRPLIALKFAASLDGKLATRTGDSQWITNRAARRYARALRGKYQAIVVGVETVLADDPRLTSRTKGARDPIRIILDSRLRIPLNARVLADTNVIIATTHRAPERKKQELLRRGVRVLSYSRRRVPIKHLLNSLRELNIMSALVEGGGKAIGSFLDAGFIDKVYAFYAPVLVGGEKSTVIRGGGVRTVSDAIRCKHVSIERFGNNILVIGSR